MTKARRVCRKCDNEYSVLAFATRTGFICRWCKSREAHMNARYVITFDAGDGTRRLAFPAQGRYTFSRREDAEYLLHGMRQNNSEERLVSLYGPKGGASLGVSEVECWPDHNDPVRSIFTRSE
jgi:hypothetical protein